MKTYKTLKRLLLPAILMLLCVCTSGCAIVSELLETGPQERVVVIPADREIVALDSGYYRVSQMWMIDNHKTTRRLLQQLEECRGRK